MLDALDRVDVARLAQDVGVMVRGIDGVVRSPELARAVRSAGDAFRSADVTLRHVDTQVGAVGGRAGAALDAARELVRKVYREVEPLAASVGTAFDETQHVVRNVDSEVDPVAGSLRTALDAAPWWSISRKALASTRTAAGESAGGARWWGPPGRSKVGRRLRRRPVASPAATRGRRTVLAEHPG